jgi:hypothetical protein
MNSHTNDHFLTDTTKHENEAPSPSPVKGRTAAPGCPWAGEGAYPTLSYQGAAKQHFLGWGLDAKESKEKAAETAALYADERGIITVYFLL